MNVGRHILAFGLPVVLLIPAFAQYPSAPRSTTARAGAPQIEFPKHYREWIYLSTGFDMSYKPGVKMHHHVFDNVFVNPEAYRVFVETGKWPGQTMLVLESRGAEGPGSINQNGNYQGVSVTGVELHVKDEAGKWAFWAFPDGRTSKLIPTSADCYSCHQAHGAVDTTFVQFYPTLLPIAQHKGTLANSYQK